MVMESPSPQCVGREFVRQYYTLMNEAPDYLHRFYSTESSFVHSGAESTTQETETVHGQKEIHKKIQDLDFSDCHTKIRQVDSQATVGNGVVVQVTGELSNRGGPMRRFMQTFILAHQTPKQYYVHNDIFRYQDEVFHDSYESEEETEIAPAEPCMENGTTAVPSVEHHEEEINEMSAPVMSAVTVSDRMPTPTQSDYEQQAPAQPATPPRPTQPSPVSTLPTPPAEPTPKSTEEPPKQEEPKSPKTGNTVEDNAAADLPAPQFSWAKIVNKSTAGQVAVVPPMNANGNVSKQPVVPLTSVIASQKEEDTSIPTATAAPAVQEDQKPARPAVEAAGKPPIRSDFSFAGERRTNERYPDNQQVFVGNLPLDVSEFQLKRFFTNYGKIVDMRINRGGGAGKVPFGFVVFDNEEPVQELLRQKRVEMDGHRLNVEEKKARNDRAGSNTRSRGTRQQQRAGSRPKDRESSGSRTDKPAHGRKGGRS